MLKYRSRLAWFPIAFFLALVLAACSNSSDSSSDDGSQAVTIGSQTGTISSGTAGSATFAAATVNVADGTAGTITWYGSSDGSSAASAPAGVKAEVSAVSSGSATVTMTADSSALSGSYYFKLTEGSAGSSVATLTISMAWQAVGIAGLSPGTASSPSLAFDSSGTPYVAYRDGGNSAKATVMYYDSSSSSWKALGFAGFSSGSADFTSLAFNSAGTPYVAYMDYGNGEKATVMYYDSSSSSWKTLGSAGFSAEGGVNYTSLAFDSSGTPYVAYMDYGNGEKATVMYYDSSASSWEALGSAGFSSGSAKYASFAIDSSGTPYVAYQDGANGNKATVMYYDGSSWNVLGSAGFSSGTANYTSLAIDSSGTPYVAYKDGINSYKATVMYYDSSSSSWKTLGSAGFSSETIDYTSLAIDSSGTPYVAYSDDGSSGKATVMYYDSSSSSWKTLGSAGFSSGYVDCPSLAIDSSGRPYVAYQDYGNSYKVTVMCYK